MKTKLIIVLVVVALVVAGAIWQEVYTHRTFETFAQKLQVLADKGEPIDINEARAVHEWWHKRQGVMLGFLPHTPLNEVQMTFGEFIGALVADDQPSAVAQLSRLQFTVHSLGDMFNLSFRNVV
jgi:hypothetical protein